MQPTPKDPTKVVALCEAQYYLPGAWRPMLCARPAKGERMMYVTAGGTTLCRACGIHKRTVYPPRKWEP